MVTLTKTQISELCNEINNKLDSLVPYNDSHHKFLYEAARYALLGPGKRLRPLLLIASANLFNVPLSFSLAPSCALEMIHAYSLIHDDLPCMDNDDYRRGRPTVHRFYSEAIALLTGDFLLTKSFECLSQAPLLNSDQKIALIKELTLAGGGEGMIGGQVLDVINQKLDLNLLQILHYKKTGALFHAAIQSGAIIGNASLEERKVLTDLGKHFGIAFQIIDDILDVTSSYEKHGKEISSDVINKKTTYVSLLGLQDAQKEAQKHIDQCYQILASFNQNELLSEIIHSVAKRIA